MENINVQNSEQFEASGLIGQTYDAAIARVADWGTAYPLLEQRDGDLIVAGTYDAQDGDNSIVVVDIENGAVVRAGDGCSDAAMSRTEVTQTGVFIRELY